MTDDPRAIRLPGASRLVHGRGRYLDDVPDGGALHAVFVRSIHAHATIRGVDPAAALTLPGVVSVSTQEDLERWGVHEQPVGWCVPGQRIVANPLLARGRVRFIGEPVAVVLAEDPYVAEDAAWLVDVAYEPLDAVAEAARALGPGAPLLYPEWGDNVLGRIVVGDGDVDAAFDAAAHVVSASFHMGRSTGMPIETRGALARFDTDGARLELVASIQSAHHARMDLAEVLGMAESDVRVIAPDVGGSFGVKDHLSPEEAVVCAVARQCRQPVKWVEDRHEHLAGCVHSREQIHELEVAADAEGGLLGLRGRVLFDAGATSGNHGIGTALYAATVLSGPYALDASRVEVIGVVTNKTPSAAYRGYGGPEAAFAIEGLLDELARRVGVDAVEIRRRNLISADAFPYTNPAGLIYDRADHGRALGRALELAGSAPGRAHDVTADGWRRGVGVACIIQRGGFGPSQAAVEAGMRFGGFETVQVRMDATGRAVVYTGLSTQGQGIDTAVAQIVAAQLGLDPVRDVTVVCGDTQTTPFSPVGAISSRGVAVGGSAAFRAAGILREKLRAVAAHVLEAAPADVELADGAAAVRGSPGRAVPIPRLARALQTGEIIPNGSTPGLEAIATYEPVDETTSYGAHVAVVDVHAATGRVVVARYVAVTDCGVLINPRTVRGQIAGAVVQGIGGALYEDLAYDEEGQFLAPTLGEYHMPTAADVPPITIELLETPTPLNPIGARGAGEIGITGPGAAIAGAVADALGAAPRRLPLTPPRVWELAQGLALHGGA
jgi:carbon-monoxide dehydrogenase large subunit